MLCATTLGWPSVSRSLCREARGPRRRCGVHSHRNGDKSIGRRSALQVAFAGTLQSLMTQSVPPPRRAVSSEWVADACAGLCLPRLLARREDALAVTNDVPLSTTDSGKDSSRSLPSGDVVRCSRWLFMWGRRFAGAKHIPFSIGYPR